MAVNERDPRVIVIGGYGVFGSHVCRELHRLGISVTVAGRRLEAAKSLAAELGLEHRALSVDAADLNACQTAIRGHDVVALCAGPFQRFGDSVLRACLEQRVPYVDISDDRHYVQRITELETAFLSRGLSAIFGCSSLPTISTAAAIRGRKSLTSPPDRVRVTLFIGNDNPKGQGAVGSAVSILGQPVRTPAGYQVGFSDGVSVKLPEPFGTRRVLNFESPDFEVLPDCIGAKLVEVKVGFESRLATALFECCANYAPIVGRTLLPRLGPFAALLPGGHSGGAVMAELFAESATANVAVFGENDGQRMAILPCTYVIQELLAGVDQPLVGTAVDLLGAEPILANLQKDGFMLKEETVSFVQGD